ncbi:MAG TPA: DUF3027 domain-containing protein [Nocardioidaceae bacterium]|nr:DUF3027 domain-containing protein [Nocardioidaceae bacterium]
MTPTARSSKPDAVLSAAVDTARRALLEAVDAADVGEHTGFDPEGDRVGTHHFVASREGYRGWRWSVTVTRGPRQRHATVDEIVLLPGSDSLVAPAWVPWKERIEPGDLGPGDLLPSDENDVRLVPGYLAGDEIIDQDSVREVTDEVGLGRERVLSLEGRDAAAERWYDGDRGPDTPIAQAAPAPCRSCGFLVRMAGPLGLMFGVCANGNSPDDARVVSFDHGCGAHSQTQLAQQSQPQPLPPPVLDTFGYDDIGDIETF